MLITSTKPVKPPIAAYPSSSTTSFTTATSSSNATSNLSSLDGFSSRSFRTTVTPLNSILNMKKSANNQTAANTTFEFKPLVVNGAGSSSGTQSMKTRRASLSASLFKTKSENVHSWLHGTYKGREGNKIAKAPKTDAQKCKFKRLNKEHFFSPEVLESFNLTEKEKFRQLIAQSMNKKTLGTATTNIANTTTFNSSCLNTTQNRTLYQKYVRSSPTQVRDDNIACVSRSYTRRISLSSDSASHVDVVGGTGIGFFLTNILFVTINGSKILYTVEEV